MKTFKHLSLIVAIAAFVFSCKQEAGNLLVGTWRITDISTNNEIPDEMKEAVKQSMEEMKSSVALVFKPDSIFEHTISEATDKGRWSISPDFKLLTLKYENGGNEVANILELTEDKLVMELIINDIKYTNTYEKQKQNK